MIPRYTRPEIGAIWSDENRFRIWLRIEILACEAMHRLGQVPAAATSSPMKTRAAISPAC